MVFMFTKRHRDEISCIISSDTKISVLHHEKLTNIKLFCTLIKISTCILFKITILILFVRQIITSIMFLSAKSFTNIYRENKFGKRVKLYIKL